jgi:tryptophan synthase beta subunit
VEYASITDDEAVESFYELTRIEGIMPALESAHAVAEAKKRARKLGKDKTIVINVSGRGDKDMESVLALNK